MSLHKFADMVAKQGRGDDSLLIHMTPDEVQRLQAFAQANGRSLTINPETGLPEAGMLSDLFKAVAPIALGAFLGPAGFGMSAAMAGVATGGITALATGSLSRGLMAGLGAYGGAGLGSALSGAGESAIASQGANLGTALTDTQAQSLGFQNAGTAAQTNALATAPIDKLSAGFNAATASPTAAMDFAKANYKPLLAAAAPIMAGAMVPTTTKFPEAKSTGNIRQMAFNINPDTGRPDPLYSIREMAPVKASEWGDKTFQGQRDLFYNQNQAQNPYQLGVASLNQPPQQPLARMADGGIVALAIGGDTKAALEDAYAKNDVAKINEIAQANMITAADVADTYKGFDTSGIKGLQLYTPPNFGDSVKAVLADQNGGGGGAPTYNQYTNEQIGQYLTTNPNIDLQQAIKATNADPAAVNAYLASLDNPFRGSTDTTGGSGTLGIYNQMKAQGIDPNELYAANKAFDPNYAGWSASDIAKGYNLDKGAYALSSQLGGNVTDKNWAKFMDDNGYSINDMAQAFGLSRNEVKARYDAAKKEEKKTTTVVNPYTGIASGAGPTTTTVLPTTPMTNAPAGTSNPYGNVNNPGDLTFNPDGTVTVTPNIPGRPYGGFSGMNEVKNAYTAGGGSLGYTAPAPRTIAEFDQLHNKQTGDSLAAYNYLMGKGANPIKSGVAQVAVPYNEFVLGKKTTRPGATVKTTATMQGTPGQPQTYFNEAEYLAANPDVAAELKSGKAKFTNAYEHYLMYGKKEGRPFTGDYQGYTTALALANAAGAGGGGEGPGPAGANNSGTISGFTPAPPDMSISEASMGIGEGNDGNTGGGPGTGADGDAAFAYGGLMPRGYAVGGGLGSLGSYSDGGRLLKGPGDGVSDSIPATIGRKQQPARLADGEFVIPARIVSELGNGSTDAGAKKLYAMMDRVQRARRKTTGKNKVAANSRADKHLPA